MIFFSIWYYYERTKIRFLYPDIEQVGWVNPFNDISRFDGCLVPNPIYTFMINEIKVHSVIFFSVCAIFNSRTNTNHEDKNIHKHSTWKINECFSLLKFANMCLI